MRVEAASSRGLLFLSNNHQAAQGRAWMGTSLLFSTTRTSWESSRTPHRWRRFLAIFGFFSTLVFNRLARQPRVPWSLVTRSITASLMENMEVWSILSTPVRLDHALVARVETRETPVIYPFPILTSACHFRTLVLCSRVWDLELKVLDACGSQVSMTG